MKTTEIHLRIPIKLRERVDDAIKAEVEQTARFHVSLSSVIRDALAVYCDRWAPLVPDRAVKGPQLTLPNTSKRSTKKAKRS